MPERAFLAAWHEQTILGTDAAGPRVTITPPDATVDPVEVVERELSTPKTRPVRSSRPLDTSARPLVERIGTGEGVDANLLERIRRNAAQQAG
jgi:hypothetical protein